MVPYVTAEPRIPYSRIFCKVASKRGMSFMRQNTSRREFTRTSSTSSGWRRRNSSTKETPREAAVAVRRWPSCRSEMPLVRMETMYLSARKPRFCISSRTSQASSMCAGPARAAVSINKFSVDSLGVTPNRGISSRTTKRASCNEDRLSKPRSTALKAAALTRRDSFPCFISCRMSKASSKRPEHAQLSRRWCRQARSPPKASLEHPRPFTARLTLRKPRKASG
mmetsp:Transcript_2967/g.7183  ORF Transcript_2967/g.7183 Transcript_2967/m.7183 type:complete len:224 (+) Transcript_2967:2260-2931(+)